MLGLNSGSGEGVCETGGKNWKLTLTTYELNSEPLNFRWTEIYQVTLCKENGIFPDNKPVFTFIFIFFYFCWLAILGWVNGKMTQL